MGHVFMLTFQTKIYTVVVSNAELLKYTKTIYKCNATALKTLIYSHLIRTRTILDKNKACIILSPLH